ncbi:MAG: dihydropyrimidinase [Flavobacteriaceae bacterium]|nr:dihydropyrimidinase [Flavobacteriaceae bacterium]
MNILIQNANLITSTGTIISDLRIENEIIVEINKKIVVSEKEKIIDATGKYVIPGGIDPHVHLHLSTGAGYSSDDFYSGSVAALYGGTTTLIDFVTPHKGQSLLEALEERKKEAENALTDYSFHVSPIDWHENIEQEIETCKELGITSFKVYLAYLQSIGLDKEVFVNVLKSVAKIGGLVTIHCEMGKEIDDLRDWYFTENKTEPFYHPLSRPSKLEADAVQMAIQMAAEADCPIYIVHVSSSESLLHIQKAQTNGQKVYGETCPQYLLLDDSKYQGTFTQTAPFVMSPPLRKKSDQVALWQAIQKGNIQTIGTDHCPFMMAQKELGIDDFRKIANGAGGIEHRLELLFTYGVLENKITLSQWVDLCSSHAAKTFGLYPRKGSIEIGSEADVVIWNPEIERIISVQTQHQNSDSNIFDGFQIKGLAETVIRRGEILIEKGILSKSLSKGNFLVRK